MEKNLSLRSIHDVLTEREPVSDPTDSLDLTGKSPLPRKPDPRAPAAAQESQPKNLSLRSIHDVLTPREKNSDPTDHDK